MGQPRFLEEEKGGDDAEPVSQPKITDGNAGAAMSEKNKVDVNDRGKNELRRRGDQSDKNVSSRVKYLEDE